MSDEVTSAVDGGVAVITMNRPESLNSLTVSMKEALIEVLHTARDDDGVRAVVLTGAGRGFCVGQDLREHAASLESGEGSRLATVREHYNPIVTALATMPKPVVAAVNGTAAGAGAAFAFACDFRVAAESAGFLMAFAKVGLGPDSGASWTLQRLVGYGRATALLMLAEPITAQQAMDMGLVNAVTPTGDVLAVAVELASRLAAGPTVALAAVKEALAFAATHGLDESLDREAEIQARCGSTSDHRDATQAFLTKTQPVFEGR